MIRYFLTEKTGLKTPIERLDGSILYDSFEAAFEACVDGDEVRPFWIE